MTVQTPTRILSSLLIINASYHMTTNQEIREGKSLPGSWEEVLAEAHSATIDKGDEKLPDGSTLLSEYKKIRDKHVPDGPKYRQFFMGKFRRDMAKEEIWNLAERIINDWLGQRGIETKC